MRKKWYGLVASLILFFSFAGEQPMYAAEATTKLLPSNDYLLLPYVNDNGKKLQFRGYQNFQVDWSAAITDSYHAKLDGNQLLLLNTDFVKAISKSNGRELWSLYYNDSLSLRHWGQSSNGTIFTIRSHFSNNKVDAKVEFINRNGHVKSSYIIPADPFTLSGFIRTAALDSQDNLIIVAGGRLVSFSPKGSMNWVNPRPVNWQVVTSAIGDTIFSRIEDDVSEIIVDSRDNVLVINNSNYAFYLNNTGEILWEKQLDKAPKDWSASGYIEETNQWVRAFGNPTAKVEILDLKSGKLTKVNKPSTAQLDLVMIKGGNGKYYVQSNRGITQIDASGKALWEYRLRLNGYTTAVSILSDSKGNVYIRDTGGSVFSLDPAGNERFVLIVKNKNSLHNIIVDEKGTLYLIDANLGVLAIKPKQK